VTLFDTADVYGRRRDDVVLVTKVGLWDSHVDVKPNVSSRPELIVECCEQSLRRLRTDRVDVLLCHLWWDENTEAFLEAFEQLKRAGKIRHGGVSTNDVDHLRHFDQDGTCDVVQLEYSLLERGAERELLPLCQERDLGVLVRGPLAKGLLTGKLSADSTFPEGDLRHGWTGDPDFRHKLDRVEAARSVAGNRPLAQVALAFVLTHPAVHAAIPGAKNPAQVEANAAAAEIVLDESDRARLDEIVAVPQ
jgi:aryl-alcohol dehydrogenase-like predicted oxidoreductase